MDHKKEKPIEIHIKMYHTQTSKTKKQNLVRSEREWPYS